MPSAANNAPKVKSSAKVHYFSEKQSYLNETSYLKHDNLRTRQTLWEGGVSTDANPRLLLNDT